VSLRAGLDITEHSKISCPCQDLAHSTVTIVTMLSQLSFTTVTAFILLHKKKTAKVQEHSL